MGRFVACGAHVTLRTYVVRGTTGAKRIACHHAILSPTTVFNPYSSYPSQSTVLSYQFVFLTTCPIQIFSPGHPFSSRILQGRRSGFRTPRSRLFRRCTMKSHVSATCSALAKSAIDSLTCPCSKSPPRLRKSRHFNFWYRKVHPLADLLLPCREVPSSDGAT